MASILGGFLRRLTGGGAEDAAGAEGAEAGPAMAYNGYTIQPAPRRDRGQWLTAGMISKDFPDGPKSQYFVRAETHASPELGKRVRGHQGQANHRRARRSAVQRPHPAAAQGLGPQLRNLPHAFGSNGR